MLPPIDEGAYDVHPAREPELLTHRYGGEVPPEPDPAAAERINALVAGSDPGGVSEQEHSSEGLDDGAAPAPEKQRGRRVRRMVCAALAIFILLPGVAFAGTYFMIDVPSPHDVMAGQAKTVNYQYSDGSLLGRDMHDGNRVMLRPDQIPDTIKHAVYAAEDATFETNTGFDITGIGRAAINQLRGGVGGGSTITQQYVKKATERDEHTMTRKALEIVTAFKMNNSYSKQEIITAYLNTVYFGRGAYGVQAASQAYFGKDVDELEIHQAALLAGIIQAPSRSGDLEYAERRWNYVMDQLVANRWLSASERESASFPKIVEQKEQTKGFSGPRRHIKERIDQELAVLGYEPDQVRQAGYTIHTTIDKRAQEVAEKTVAEVMEGQPEELRKALVAVDPNTGGIIAYYGGPYDSEDQQDWARVARNPGSSFKPFDLVALLKKDKGLGETYDGRNELEVPGRDTKVRNAQGASCGANCTVAEAMKRSINTVFYDMVLSDITPNDVATAAHEAGIPEQRGDRPSFGENIDANISIGGGSTVTSPREMAGAYAAFAAEGIKRDTHLVQKITTPDDETVYQATRKGEPAFDSDREKSKQIAGNVTTSLEPVLPHSNRTCAGGRACAGKTGTHQFSAAEDQPDGGNAEAWMVGYSRQVSAAVWVGTGQNQQIKDANGADIYGSGLPAEIWQKFMNTYHEGMPNEPFDDVEPIGKPTPAPAPPPAQSRPEPAAPQPEPEETQERPENGRPENPGRPEPSEPEQPPPGDDEGDNGGGGLVPRPGGGGGGSERPTDETDPPDGDPEQEE